MGVIEIKGLAALKQRFAEIAAADALAPTLREGAEAVAAEAVKALAPRGTGTLARSVEIIDTSQEDRPSFEVGTKDPVGRYLEFGTTKMRARPWLGPALHTHLPRIKRSIRKLFSGAAKRDPKGPKGRTELSI